MSQVRCGLRIGGAAGLVAVMLLVGCDFLGGGRLDCHDVLPTDQSRFMSVAALMTASGGKGCSGCHSARISIAGYNFSDPRSTYNALSSNFGVIYDTVESGYMPKKATAWDAADLKLLRSWKCNGGTDEEWVPSP